MEAGSQSVSSAVATIGSFDGLSVTGNRVVPFRQVAARFSCRRVALARKMRASRKVGVSCIALVSGRNGSTGNVAGHIRQMRLDRIYKIFKIHRFGRGILTRAQVVIYCHP